jgi:hypothetical protein
MTAISPRSVLAAAAESLVRALTHRHFVGSRLSRKQAPEEIVKGGSRRSEWRRKPPMREFARHHENCCLDALKPGSFVA